MPRPDIGSCVKQFVRDISGTRRLAESARRDPLFNPGAAWVSNLSAEPVIFREVLDDFVRPAQAQGRSAA